MLIEGVYFMDKTCINCRHFRQGSAGPTKPEHVWGDCLKAKKHAWVTGDTDVEQYCGRAMKKAPALGGYGPVNKQGPEQIAKYTSYSP